MIWAAAHEWICLESAAIKRGEAVIREGRRKRREREIKINIDVRNLKTNEKLRERVKVDTGGTGSDRVVDGQEMSALTNVLRRNKTTNKTRDTWERMKAKTRPRLYFGWWIITNHHPNPVLDQVQTDGKRGKGLDVWDKSKNKFVSRRRPGP